MTLVSCCVFFLCFYIKTYFFFTIGTWYTNESKENLETELNRIKKEKDELVTYIPEGWGNVTVSYKPLLSAIDGKVMCALTHVKNSALCPFCTIGWEQVMDDLLEAGFEEENMDKVLELANNGVTSPLHILLHFLVLTFKVGFRNQPGTRTYRKKMSKEQKKKIAKVRS